MDVGRRVDFGARSGNRCGNAVLVDRFSAQRGFGRSKPDRPIGDTDRADMNVRGAASFIQIVEQRDAGHGKIALAASKFP